MGRVTNRSGRLAPVWIAMILAGTIGAKPAAAPVASHEARVKSVTLAMRHRVFKNFSDLQEVTPQKEFLVGDSDFSARVIRYVPDFAMNLKTGKVESRSKEPRNPAFQIIVKEKKVAQDTTWAFMNLPPHFGRKSMLAFKIVRIDFVGAPPVVADTTKAAPPAAAAGTKP
ncbi:MAG TPA: hypothetical protein VFU59_03270 [Candidatus Eisenbacteria bacterium]|nr:hypothetical protein [Candidatus Eisenbacteria bacterium]